MDAKLDNLSEMSQFLSVKTRMSDDLFHSSFWQVWHRSPVISAVIGETGRSFSFGIDSFSLLEASSYLYRAHSSHFRRSAWDDAPTPYGYNQRQR